MPEAKPGPLDEGGLQSPGGSVEGHARTGDPPADDQHVERLVAEASHACRGRGERGALTKTATSFSRRSTEAGQLPSG